MGPVAGAGRTGVPQWRSQLRDKMFRTKALILSSYILFWMCRSSSVTPLSLRVSGG